MDRHLASAAIHSAASGLHRTKLIDRKAMREYDEALKRHQHIRADGIEKAGPVFGCVDARIRQFPTQHVRLVPLMPVQVGLRAAEEVSRR